MDICVMVKMSNRIYRKFVIREQWVKKVEMIIINNPLLLPKGLEMKLLPHCQLLRSVKPPILLLYIYLVCQHQHSSTIIKYNFDV